MRLRTLLLPAAAVVITACGSEHAVSARPPPPTTRQAQETSTLPRASLPDPNPTVVPTTTSPTPKNTQAPAVVSAAPAPILDRFPVPHPIRTPVTTRVPVRASQSVRRVQVAGGSKWACIVSHESGGNPGAVNRSSGAAGLYQFMPATWHSLGYSGSAASYPASVQTAAALRLQAMYGWSPWAGDGC
jgi:hypothetical protein